MNSSTWKAFERRLAKELNTERHSKSGLGEPVPDIIAREVKLREKVNLVVEAKMRKTVSKFLEDGLEQLKKARSDEGAAHILVVKKKNLGDKNALVVMRWKTFCEKFLDVEDNYDSGG